MANTIFQNLSTNQRFIVRDICKLQLSSLRRLYNNEHKSDDDLELLLSLKGISKEEWEDTLEDTLGKFKEVLTRPHLFYKLDKLDLSIFRHILTHIEEQYNKDYAEDISNLWERLFIIEDFFSKTPMQNLN